MTKGPMMTLEEASRYGDISMHKLKRYIKNGWLVTHGPFNLVYYRDVLRAAWTAEEYFKTVAGKANPNYGKKKPSKYS
jgi:hypothetical protein